MTEDKANELKDRLRDALYWTLRGGNDPDDGGNVVSAIEELGTVLIEVITELRDERRVRVKIVKEVVT